MSVILECVEQPTAQIPLAITLAAAAQGTHIAREAAVVSLAYL